MSGGLPPAHSPPTQRFAYGWGTLRGKMENENRIQIETPIGTLIGYVNDDPDYPGIFIDLMPTGEEYMINMSGTECQIDEETGETTLVTHVWADRGTEDTTHDIEHIF